MSLYSAEILLPPNQSSLYSKYPGISELGVGISSVLDENMIEPLREQQA